MWKISFPSLLVFILVITFLRRDVELDGDAMNVVHVESTRPKSENITNLLPSVATFGTTNESNLVTSVRNRESKQEEVDFEKAAFTTTRHSTGSAIMDAVTDPLTKQGKTFCCLRSPVDPWTKLTPEYFEKQRTRGSDFKTKWTGKEYEDWVAISSRLNPNNQSQTSLDCAAQYSLLVLDQVSGPQLRSALTDLKNDKQEFLPFAEESPGLPRILLLGDSISHGIRVQTQNLYHSQANVQGAPTNCGGFKKYERLKDWLGSCPWDLVQFNVGMHFHPGPKVASWHEDYEKGIRNIVTAIRAHSPSARVVFALTTPSPFDSNETMPKRGTCPDYDKFHEAGFVSSMNMVAVSLAKQLGFVVNDRYTAILPWLSMYQKECNIHYSEDGYKLLAQQDWKVFSSILSVEATQGRNASK